MIFDFETIETIQNSVEQLDGWLEFHCDALLLFEGAKAFLDGPLQDEIQDQARQTVSAKPDLVGKLLASLGGEVMDGAKAAHLKRRAQSHWQNCRVLVAESRFTRAIADLTEQERSVLLATCAHTRALRGQAGQQEELLRFFVQLNAKLVWAGGRGQFIPSPQAEHFQAEARSAERTARAMMMHVIAKDHADHTQEIAGLLSQYVQAAQHTEYAAAQPESAKAIANVIQPAQTFWAGADMIHRGETPFREFESGSDLLLGALTGSTGPIGVGFAGNESLVTIAQPGAGKTQCHILPNLLTYDGPVVVLDPKLELLEASGGYRQSAGHRVLVLSLSDEDEQTHRFNVLEFIDTRPDFLWGAVIELANFLIPENPGDNSPIFRTKAAELFAVCLGGTVLEAREQIDPPTLTRAIHHIFSSIETLKAFLFDTQDRAEQIGSLPLAQSAGSLAALAENDFTREDFQRYQSNATSVLMTYRGGLIDRVAGGVSDWAPEDLRTPGTSLYIRIPYEEMAVFGGFVRMVLYTIIKRLRKAPTEQGELPVTFLLDEVAQLGNLDQIANVIETGRGYGLRVWMIFQDEQQARAASTKPNLLLKTPHVRLFMNPSLDTARDMSAQLGSLHQILTGKDKAIAEPAELMGPAFKSDVVVLSSGSRPLRLSKHFAYTDPSLTELMSLPFVFARST